MASTEKKDILEFRLYGDGISPKVFKAKEVGEILINFEDALKGYIFENNPTLDTKDLFVSPVAINDQSLGLKFTPNVAKYFVPAFISITTAIKANNVSTLPATTRHALTEVQKIIRIKNCNAEFKIDGEVLANIDANTELSVIEDIIKGDSIIYGVVQRVGGNEPTVWVILNNGKRVVLHVDVPQAKKLSHRLYEEVGFKGNAKWAKQSLTLLEFKVYDILDQYQPRSLKESFGEIKSIIGKYWDKIDDINNALLKG